MKIDEPFDPVFLVNSCPQVLMSLYMSVVTHCLVLGQRIYFFFLVVTFHAVVEVHWDHHRGHLVSFNSGPTVGTT